MREMTKISFYSALGNRIRKVKVSLQEIISAGVQAQVYHGCYYDTKSKSEKCVAVKLIGTGTQQTQNNALLSGYEKQLKELSNKDQNKWSSNDKMIKVMLEENIRVAKENKSNSLKAIVEDSMNEISVLKMFQERFANENKPLDHIINMYDGGSIIKIHGDKDKEQMFDYIIILELGNGTFLEKILSTAENHVKDEKMLMSVLSEPTKVLIQIHEAATIHMDFKPQNLVYVSVDTNKSQKEQRLKAVDVSGETSNVQEEKHLKAIDFGGSMILNPTVWNNKSSAKSKINNLTKFARSFSLPANFGGKPNLEKSQTNNKTNIVEKMICTRQYKPPELDTDFLIEQAKLQPSQANSKTRNASATTKSDVWMFGMICYELLLYIKYYSLVEDKERLKRTINDKLLNINTIYKWKNILLDNKFIASTSEQEINLEHPSIEGLKDEIMDIIEIKSDYPKIFQLVSNLLQPEPKHRLSANGILDFLIGKCRIESMDDTQFSIDQFIKEDTKENISLLEQAFSIGKRNDPENDVHRNLDDLLRLENRENLQMQLPICDQSFRLDEIDDQSLRKLNPIKEVEQKPFEKIESIKKRIKF
uniref:Protein kinase domain-containing protein n=1 Tax=Meloidogyne incognita TaxID=6306 RepID=A0A914LED7_MELIC